MTPKTGTLGADRQEPGALPRPADDGLGDAFLTRYKTNTRRTYAIGAAGVPQLVPDQRPGPAGGEAPARRAVLPLDGGAEVRADDHAKYVSVVCLFYKYAVIDGYISWTRRCRFGGSRGRPTPRRWA
jgi:hypothetical protein